MKEKRIEYYDSLYSGGEGKIFVNVTFITTCSFAKLELKHHFSHWLLHVFQLFVGF